MTTGKDPGNVLRYVASGVFVKKAFTGGATMAAWGFAVSFYHCFCPHHFLFLALP